MILDKAVLIFPAGMPRALDFLGKCVREQHNVIGASSLVHDPARQNYPAWLFLPYVTHDGFDDALGQAVRDFDIGGIYTPNPVVWDYLSRALERIAPGVPLLNASPANVELEAYRAAHLLARELLGKPLPLAVEEKGKTDWSELEVASLYRHVETVPGMCDHEKVRALYEIARYCPAGDVIEIGSWWGKSAFVLLRLAQCFNIGNLMCVDPWSDGHLVQNDKNGLVDTVSAQFSAEEAFNVFQINLLPYSAGNINYLRLPSTDGAKHYRLRPQVESPAFGATSYSGHIALLHIDGNHSYDNVKADIEAWCPLVMEGGWIVMDDYNWPFGDGPKLAANEYLATNSDRISTAFVMGGALFIRLTESSPVSYQPSSSH